jgi:hypothetical protein
MEVHQHTHTPRKKWTHYLWEFLMLFLAVFCGFLAENQREHYVEHQREKKFMRSLVQDLKADTAHLQSYIGFRTQKRMYMDSLTLLLCSNLHKQMGNETYYYARFVLLSPSFVSTDGTMQQLKNAGNLRLITNGNVIDNILAYDAAVRSLNEWDEIDTRIKDGFREMGGNVFNSRHFSTTIDSALHFIKPTNNPQLTTSDTAVINNVSFQVQYLAAVTLGNIVRAKGLKAKATNLLELLKNEYHLK